MQNFLSYDEWLETKYAEDALPAELIDQITEDVLSIMEESEEIEDIIKYLYENYNIELGVDDFLDDVLVELDEAEAEEPKKSVGQKVKGHFKKHWKKYATGAAAGTGAVIGGGALLHHLAKKNMKKAQAQATKHDPTAFMKGVKGTMPGGHVSAEDMRRHLFPERYK